MNKSAKDIRYSIGQLGAAELELFCCALLSSLEGGHRYGKIDSGVNADGETTKGTPDAMALLPSGKYAAFQSTTQRSGQHRKILTDLAKLADPAKCPISQHVEDVTCRVTS